MPTPTQDDTHAYHPLLKCFLHSMSYDFTIQTGEVWMPKGSCVDMDGVRRLFLAIDPAAKTIITWAAGKLDTTFFRTVDDLWIAKTEAR